MPVVESIELSQAARVAELLDVINQNVRALAALASDSNRDSNPPVAPVFERILDGATARVCSLSRRVRETDLF